MTPAKPPIPHAPRGVPRIRSAGAYVDSRRRSEAETSVTPARAAFEAERRASTARWGALTLDSAWSSRRVWTSSSAPYRTFTELLACARRVLGHMGLGARYYSYHSGLGADVVIELSRGVPVATRVTGLGRELVQSLGAGDERVLAEDAALREVAGSMEERGLDASLGAIGIALEVARGRAELLPVAVDLIRAGKYALAVSVVEQRLQLAPDDVNAMLLDARITINLVRDGRLGLEHLKRADDRFQRVLALDPNDLRALSMWSEVPRLAGNPTGSVPRYEAVLARFPGCEVAHYSLATLLLGNQPQRALLHFSAGERLCPEDPDYSIGRARALLAMGCIEEARAALARARDLAPAHPVLPLLEVYTSFGRERRTA